MKQDGKLRTELRQAGASDSEARELSDLAASLKQLKGSMNAEMPVRRREKWSVGMPVLASVSGLVLGMTLVILSQMVLPGNPLYPVQKLSDNVAMSVTPSYRGIVMMKRAQEVKQLVAAHASSSLVLATLNDYKSEASAYKATTANYAAFEFCKSNLVQAATIAPSSERHLIDSTLSSLQDV